MFSKIKNVKNSVKSHVKTNRAKYAGTIGFIAGVAVTREVYIWRDGYREIMALDDSTTE